MVWLAFDFPAFQGKVLFPVDAAARASPYDRYGGGPGGYPVIEGDAFNQYYPMRAYLARRLREGDLPLWDPHRLAGTPFAANPQAGVWYPPNWLYATGDVLGVYSWLSVLSRLGALLLCFWFLRVLRLHPYAAALGAVVFTFSGFLTAWTLHPTFIASGMWLPLALGGITLAVREETWRGPGLAAVGLGLSVLGGHPQVVLYVWLASGIWALVLLAAAAVQARRAHGVRPALRQVAGGSLRSLGAFALGAGMGAVQLLGALELQRHVVRQVEAYEETTENALPTAHLSSLLLPDRMGNPRDQNYVWGDFLNYSETALYAGVLPLALAGGALVLRRDRVTAAFVALGLVGILAALGTPFYRLLYEIVPGVSRTRVPARFVFLVDVAIAGLSAIGADAALRRRRGGTTALGVALAVVFALVVWAALADVPGIPSSYLAPQALRAGAIIAVGGVVLLAFGRDRSAVRHAAAVVLVGAVAVDLWRFGFGYHPFRSPQPVHPLVPEVSYLGSVPGPRPRFARAGGWVLPPDIASQHGLYDIQTWDNLILRGPVELMAIAHPSVEQLARGNAVGFFEPSDFKAPVMDLLGVRSVVAEPGTPDLGPPRFRGAVDVFGRSTTLPPAYVASCWEVVPRGDVLDRLAGFDTATLASVAVVPDDGETTAALPSHPPSCPSAPVVARVVAYEPERVALRVAARAPGVLIVTDTWYPGWTALVDGREAPVLPVDGALRGVPVGAGSHAVELRYRPWWLVPGIGVSVGSAIASTLLWLSRRRRGNAEAVD